MIMFGKNKQTQSGSHMWHAITSLASLSNQRKRKVSHPIEISSTNQTKNDSPHLSIWITISQNPWISISHPTLPSNQTHSPRTKQPLNWEHHIPSPTISPNKHMVTTSSSPIKVPKQVSKQEDMAGVEGAQWLSDKIHETFLSRIFKYIQISILS